MSVFNGPFPQFCRSRCRITPTNILHICIYDDDDDDKIRHLMTNADIIISGQLISNPHRYKSKYKNILIELIHILGILKLNDFAIYPVGITRGVRLKGFIFYAIRGPVRP